MIIKRLKNIPAVSWLLISCIFIDTVGQFIPIYFTFSTVKTVFYIIILLCLLSTSFALSYKTVYRQSKNNWIYSTSISFITTLLVSVVFGTFTIVKIWPADDVIDTVIYVKTNNKNIQIVRRYFDLGATGESISVIKVQPLTSFLKIETKIDTNSINKVEWSKKIYINVK